MHHKIIPILDLNPKVSTEAAALRFVRRCCTQNVQKRRITDS